MRLLEITGKEGSEEMVFQIKTYSVLLVSSADQFHQSMMNLLPVNDFWPVTTVRNAAEARRSLLENVFDIVIINAPLTDEFGSRFAMDVCAEYNSSVLLFVKNESYEDVSAKVMEFGAFVLSKPASLQVISQTLKLLCAMRERMIKMEEKQISVEEKIAEIRLINHAKWLLIEQKQMTENEAQRYIEKTAMDLRRTKKQIAEELVEKMEKGDKKKQVP